MKKFVLSIVIFTLIVAVCAGAGGCSNDLQDNILNQQNSNLLDATLNNSVSSDTESKGMVSMDYTLIEQAGVNYIVFDNILVYHEDGQNEVATLEFESLAKLKDSVTNGKLTEWQKKVIATSFKQDKTGVVTCDFNKLLEPRMPNECKIDGVSWGGESYSFYISTASEVFGFIHNYSQSQYNEIFDRDFEDYFNKTTITVTETFDTDDGKKVTTYSTAAGELMQIRYTYVNESKTIVVDETYRLNMGNESLATSDKVPTNITLYCTEPGAYYVVDLFGFTEKPSDSWLYEFGMKQYVDLEIAEK